MNCSLCKENLEAYREQRLPVSIRTQVENHLQNCSGCKAIYQMEVLAYKVVEEEKETQPNPFLATRVMVGIEALEMPASTRVPVYRKIIKPALISLSLSAAVTLGVLVGSLYQPGSDHEKVPVELSYVNDALLESVDLLSDNE